MELLIIIVIIISAAFPDPRDIKMGHSILRTFSKKKKKKLHLPCIFFVLYCRKHFLNSFISNNKPWESLIFVLKAFKKYSTVSYFINLRETVKLLNGIHLYLWRELFSRSCTGSIVFEKKPSFFLNW